MYQMYYVMYTVCVCVFVCHFSMQDNNNLCVFRLCSLWFDNCSDEVVNGLLKVQLVYVCVHGDSCKLIVGQVAVEATQ